MTGPAGIGKSTALETMVSACRAAGWLTFYLPDPRTFTHDGIQVRPGRHEDQNLYDQPELVLPFLKNFYLLHQEQLKQVMCKSEGGKERGETMLDLVEHGIRKPIDCGVVICDIREEMKLATEVPTLVAVDDLEALYTKTIYGFKGVDLWPSNLVFSRQFQNFSALGFNEAARLENGFVIAASTSKYAHAQGVHGERLSVEKHAFPLSRFSVTLTGDMVRDYVAKNGVERGQNRSKSWKGPSGKDIARIQMISGGVPKNFERGLVPALRGQHDDYAPGGSFTAKDKIKNKRAMLENKA